MKKILLLAAFAVGLAGCSSSNQNSEQYKYTPPTPVPLKPNAEVNVPYDLLWGRAKHWMADKGFQPEGDLSNGVLTSTIQNNPNGARYLDCGKGGSRVSIAPPTTVLSVMVTQNGDKSVASITLRGNTTVSYVDDNGEKVPAPSITPTCVSNGQLEADFISNVGR